MENEKKILILSLAGVIILSSKAGAKIMSEIEKIIGYPKPIPLENIDWTVKSKIIFYSNLYGLEPAIPLSIAMIESAFKVDAKNPSDPSYGLFALTPALCYDYGLIQNYKNPTDEEIKKIYDLDNNCRIGIKHLSRLFSLYPEDQAVQSYNVGITGYLKGKRNSSYLNKYYFYRKFYKEELQK